MKFLVSLLAAFSIVAGVTIAAPVLVQPEPASATTDEIRVEPEHASLRPSCTGYTPTIRGTSGDDVLVGTAGDDIIVGWAGNDTIDGKGGNDIIIGGAGDDTISGGNGDDLICGSRGNDTLLGNAGVDRISGGADDDTIAGGNSDDVLFGLNGNDIITGNAGDDTISGGAGDDDLNGQADDDVVYGNGGADLIRGSGGDDELWGSWGGDEIRGGVGDDFISGGPGWDRLFGWTGADEIQGGDGNDRLWGGPGDDLLNGMNGDDRLSGGEDTDTLIGGDGDDTALDADETLSDDPPPTTTTTVAPTTTTSTTTTTVPVAPEDLPIPQLYASSDGVSTIEIGWPILAGTGVAGVEVFRNGTSIGVSVTSRIVDDGDFGPFGFTYTAQSISDGGVRSKMSEPFTFISSPTGQCDAVALNDGTTAITWVDAPEGDVTLLDQANGRYLPLEWLPRNEDNGAAYHLDSVTDQAGASNPDYRVTIANPDGTFSSQACVGGEFNQAQFDRLAAMDFPVTDDGMIGRSVPPQTGQQEQLANLFAEEVPAPAPAPGAAVTDLCTTGSIGFSGTSPNVGGQVVVEFDVPAGVEVRGDLNRSGVGRTFGAMFGSFAVSRKVGDTWVGVPSFLNAANYGGTPSFTEDQRVFAAPSAGTYRVTAGPTGWHFMSSANWSLLNVRFTDSDGNFVADPCSGLEQITHCLALGGGVYVAPGALPVVRDGQTLGPGCYAVETCASPSSWGAIFDSAAQWACRNDPFLDTAQDVAIATAVVLGVIVFAPVSAGVVLTGAGLGLVISPFTCDQSDNGALNPSFDLDVSCVATEVALGAVFAPLQAVGRLGRAIAIGCVEGGVSTTTYGYVHADTDLNAENVALGTALGCASGGIVHAGVNRIASRSLSSAHIQRLAVKADDIRETLKGGPFAIGGTRNVAVAEYWIDGKAGELIAVSGSALRPGTVNPPTEPVFAAFDFDWDRALDSEYKILEELAAELGTARPLSGVVHIYSELPICASCSSVIQQFEDRYGVEVLVAYGR